MGTYIYTHFFLLINWQQWWSQFTINKKRKNERQKEKETVFEFKL